MPQYHSSTSIPHTKPLRFYKFHNYQFHNFTLSLFIKKIYIKALKNSNDKNIYYECIKSSIEDNIQGFVDVLVREQVLAVPLNFKTFIDVFAYLNTLPNTFNITINEYPYLKIFSNPETIDSMFQKIIDNNLSNISFFISGSHIGMMKNLLAEKNALYGRFIPCAKHTISDIP